MTTTAKAGRRWGGVDAEGRFALLAHWRVDMSLQLTNELERLVAHKKADALTRELAKPEPESKRCKPDEVINMVMESPLSARKDDGPLDPNDLRRPILYKGLTAAGIRRVRFHDSARICHLATPNGERP